MKEMREVHELFNQWNKLRRDIVRMKFVRLVCRFSKGVRFTSFDEEIFRLKSETFRLLTNQTVDRAMSLRGPTFNPPVPNMRAFPRRDYGERADRTKFRRDISKAKSKMKSRFLNKEKLLKPNSRPQTAPSKFLSKNRVDRNVVCVERKPLNLENERKEREKKIKELDVFERLTKNAHVPKGRKKVYFSRKKQRPYTAPSSKASREVRQNEFQRVQRKLHDSLFGSFISPKKVVRSSSSRNGRNGGCSSFFMTSSDTNINKAEVK